MSHKVLYLGAKFEVCGLRIVMNICLVFMNLYEFATPIWIQFTTMFLFTTHANETLVQGISLAGRLALSWFSQVLQSHFQFVRKQA